MKNSKPVLQYFFANLINNCFFIEGKGIYVFFPEINKLFFYEQKAGKDFTFQPDNMQKVDDDFISFQKQNSTNKLFLKQLFKNQIENLLKIMSIQVQTNEYLSKGIRKQLFSSTEIHKLHVNEICYEENEFRYILPNLKFIKVSIAKKSKNYI